MTDDQAALTATDGLRVGEISQATGLTVRTLHYYDELGLVRPDRTSSGHRVYRGDHVQRLYRIQLLRALGWSLADTERVLATQEWDPVGLTTRSIEELDARLADLHRLRDRLAGIVGNPRLRDDTAALLATLKEMTMTDQLVRRRIPTLVYRDVAAAHAYLVRVFAFEPGRIDVDQEGHAVHAEVTAGDGIIWLHRIAPEFGLDSPANLGAETAGMSIIVDDVDEHFARAVAEGASIDYAPVDQPYGYREYAAKDLDGRLWAFMTPIA